MTFALGVSPEGPIIPRAYTLTHSDSTGELFFTIGATFDRHQISGWYTRLLRDEVLGEWGSADGAVRGSASEAQTFSARLDIHCHVSGGFVLGTAGWRAGILRSHMPLVIEAFRCGDVALIRAHPGLDEAPIWVHFHSTRRGYDLTEHWGRFGEYRTG